LDFETRVKAMTVQYLQSLLRNFESLNAILAKYWCGLPLRNYSNSVNVNLYPHAEVPSAFYIVKP
jgi:hypothetical protein